MKGLLKLVSLLFGGSGGIPAIAEQVRLAHEAKLAASTHDQKLAADLDMQRLSNALDMARVANDDRWSATSIGRYLIVVPFGVWWTAIFIDSTFTMPWNVLDIPPDIKTMAKILVPGIVLGDVAKTVFKHKR